MQNKSQAVRLVDVFLLGPFMIYLASQQKFSNAANFTLGAAGVLTITYNWRNYQLNKQLGADNAIHS